MRRVLSMVVATVCLLSTNAMAATISFSFSNAIGNVAGTVTGEIFGLQNNAIGPATEVLITSYPAALGVLPDLNVTNWHVNGNQFQMLGGVISFASLDAVIVYHVPSVLQGLSAEILLDTSMVIGPPGRTGRFPSSLDNSLPTDRPFLSRLVFVLGATTYTTAAAPEPSAWILFLTGMLAVAIVKRIRRTDGLAILPPE